MNTPKFTPGPWETRRARKASVWSELRDVAIVDPRQPRGDGIIAEVFYQSAEETFQPVQANAHLIAAAPEMYEIVRKVAEYYDCTDAPIGIQARAALAKAEGRAS